MFEKRHPTYLLVLIALCGLAALTFALYGNRAHAALTTQDDLLNYARLASVEHSAFLGEIQELLSTLALVPEVRGSDAKACDSLMTDVIGDRSEYINIGVAGTDGQVWCSGVPFTPPVDETGKTYFTRAMQSGGFSIGDYQYGVVSKQNVVPFGYPVRDAKGNIQGIISVAVNINWLGDFIKDANLPTTTTLALVDNTGKVIAEYPESDTIGEVDPIANLPISSIVYLEQNLGEYLTQTGTNGGPYYVISAPLTLEPQGGFLHLIMSIPQKSVDD